VPGAFAQRTHGVHRERHRTELTKVTGKTSHGAHGGHGETTEEASRKDTETLRENKKPQRVHEGHGEGWSKNREEKCRIRILTFDDFSELKIKSKLEFY